MKNAKERTFSGLFVKFPSFLECFPKLKPIPGLSRASDQTDIYKSN